MCSKDGSKIYADGSVLIYFVQVLEEFTEPEKTRFRDIVKWCHCNSLSLISLKSKSMILTDKILVARPHLLIGSDLIEEIISFKYIGRYTVKYNFK